MHQSSNLSQGNEEFENESQMRCVFISQVCMYVLLCMMDSPIHKIYTSESLHCQTV